MGPPPRALRNVCAHLAAAQQATPARLVGIDTSNAPSLQRHGSRDPVPASIPQITPSMTNLELRRQFEEEGFVHIKGLFTRSEAQEMERELERFIADVLPTSGVGAYYHDEADPNTLFQIDTMADEPYFDTLMNGARGQSKVNDVVEVLFGERAVGLVHFFNRIPGEVGSHETPPHQDAAYSSQLCTAWVAVDAADEENGCMRYSVGSHLRDLPGLPVANGGGPRTCSSQSLSLSLSLSLCARARVCTEGLRA